MAADAVATIGVNGLLAALPFVKGAKGAAAGEEQAGGKIASEGSAAGQARLRMIEQNKAKFKLRRDLDPQWFEEDGTLRYPDNDGAIGEWKTTTIKKGQVVDRYGLNRGKYFSDAGTSFEQRSLPSDPRLTEYHRFRVLKDFETSSSRIQPFYDQPGNGVQYMTDKSASSLVEDGYLEEVNPNE